MIFFTLLFISFQILLGAYFILPVLLQFFALISKKQIEDEGSMPELDYAIIVTAYEQVSLIPAVVDSILRLNYSNYLVYIVADNCDVSELYFESDKVILLKPTEILCSNIKSHFFAVSNFKRKHETLTIIDSDNLVDPEFLNELNRYFYRGFAAVQGVRKAKNLDTKYACIDEAGDMYYRYIDRKLLFDVGSSASLAGSGMAFTTKLYRECLEHINVVGAGFDKVLQIEVLKRRNRIAFAERAIVYDEKTSKSNQLVNQRSRWINTWFKYANKGLNVFGTGLMSFDFGLVLSGIVFSRPPLFILGSLAGLTMILDLILIPYMTIFWLVCIVCFFTTFFCSLVYFKASKAVYSALFSLPVFFYYQVVSLLRAKGANKRSVATLHFHTVKKHSDF